MNKELNAYEWLKKEGYPLTMPMTRDNLANILNRYAQWQAEQKEVSASLGFAKWLEENTEVIREEKITLYRYCDKNNEWGNYTLNDIYAEWLDELPQQKQVPTDASEIVKEFARWSLRYPSSQIYSYSRQPKMDLELTDLEERAKKWLAESQSPQQ